MEGFQSTLLTNRAPKNSRLLKTHFVATKKLTRVQPIKFQQLRGFSRQWPLDLRLLFRLIIRLIFCLFSAHASSQQAKRFFSATASSPVRVSPLLNRRNNREEPRRGMRARCIPDTVGVARCIFARVSIVVENCCITSLCHPTNSERSLNGDARNRIKPIFIEQLK
jgi:hypothetical protein